MSEIQLRRIMAYYYGAITQIDDGIGEIVDLLKKKGVYDDTDDLFYKRSWGIPWLSSYAVKV